MKRGIFLFRIGCDASFIQYSKNILTVVSYCYDSNSTQGYFSTDEVAHRPVTVLSTVTSITIPTSCSKHSY